MFFQFSSEVTAGRGTPSDDEMMTCLTSDNLKQKKNKGDRAISSRTRESRTEQDTGQETGKMLIYR